MRNLLFLILWTLSSCSVADQPPTNPIRVNDGGVAIDGYSPVSYFTEGIPERGNEEFTIVHQGVNYWLTSIEQIEMFLLDPERYIPAHGGWCSLMIGGSGRRTPGHPESFAIVDDKLLLFWSGDTPEMKGMGLSNWESKTRGSERRERGAAQAADRKWTSFLQGDRDAPVYLYKPSDLEAVNAAQRANATIAFEQ